MFKNIFSFDGRIRRTEYGISLIILFVCFIIVELISEGLNGNKNVFLLDMPVLWFIWAQGAKRCHDLGKSGWWQLIPFYGIWMLFAEGMLGINEYGENPKGNTGYQSATYADPYPVYDSGVIPVYDDSALAYDDGGIPDQDVVNDDQSNDYQSNINDDDASFNDDSSF